MDIQKLTKEQAVIISGFTGILCGEFSDFHADVEKRLGRGVQTFEFGFKEFSAEVKRLYEADFIEMGTVSKEEAKAQAVPEESKHEGGYYLQDCRGYIGNCMKFWYTHGYGAKLHNFHWFPTLDDALKAAGGAPWHKPWYAPYVDSLAEKTIDMQLADREQEKAMIEAQENS
ncbi:hypothetical protein NQU59_09150 [Acinetobacter colistiniresistens]|uniref:DUF7736 domain-containing protein n=1 Tax=Acinetobacter TaxID=469 RepID=UPI00211C0B60|nr:hypothetical protein [Acinetobacter colistiniresistens]UUM25920.1 hypothetical protein NQU59_09150 [Acinetobacter colistiniresistens]